MDSAPSSINDNNTHGSNNNSSIVSGLKANSLPVVKHDSSTNNQQHQLISANSFEQNGMTTSSLSEDSGLPATTNSSISSGDSSRFGMCKSAFEVRVEE